MRYDRAWLLALAVSLALGAQGTAASGKVIAVGGCGGIGTTLIHLPADPDAPPEDRDSLACHAPCLAQSRRIRP